MICFCSFSGEVYESWVNIKPKTQPTTKPRTEIARFHQMRWENWPILQLQDRLPSIGVASTCGKLHVLHINPQRQAMPAGSFVKTRFTSSPQMARHLGVMLQLNCGFSAPCTQTEEETFIQLMIDPGFLNTSDP